MIDEMLNRFFWMIVAEMHCDAFIKSAAYAIEEIEFNTVTEPMFPTGPNWTKATIASVTFKDRIVLVDF